jgi:hypothetical protein
VHDVFDLGRGGFAHLELTDGHGADALDGGAPHPGEIRIGDRNYTRAAGCDACPLEFQSAAPIRKWAAAWQTVNRPNEVTLVEFLVHALLFSRWIGVPLRSRSDHKGTRKKQPTENDCNSGRRNRQQQTLTPFPMNGHVSLPS